MRAVCACHSVYQPSEERGKSSGSESSSDFSCTDAPFLHRSCTVLAPSFKAAFCVDFCHLFFSDTFSLYSDRSVADTGQSDRVGRRVAQPAVVCCTTILSHNNNNSATTI
jgi:hypothetical protein